MCRLGILWCVSNSSCALATLQDRVDTDGAVRLEAPLDLEVDRHEAYYAENRPGKAGLPMPRNRRIGRGWPELRAA